MTVKNLQTCIGGPQFDGNWILLNLFKASAYYPTTNIGYYPGQWVDANGYPTNLSGTDPNYGGVISYVEYTFLAPDPALRPGNLILEWSGASPNCTITFSGSTGNSIVSTTGPGASGRIEVTPATNVDGLGFFLNTFRMTGTTGPTSIDVYHKDRETLFKTAGKYFNPDAVAVLSKFKTLRFLGHTGVNGSFASVVNDVPVMSQAAYTYAPNARDSATILAGSMVKGANNAYTIASPPSGFSFAAGRQRIRSVTSGTYVPGDGPMTLTIGGVTKPVYTYNYFQKINKSYSEPATQPQDGQGAFLIVDPVLDAFIWAPAASAVRGWPPELMAALCVECGCDAWYPFPILMLNPITPAVAYILNIFHDALVPHGLTTYAAVANEVWNYLNADYSQTRYCWAVASKLAGVDSADHDTVYAGMASRLGQAVNTIFGNDKTKGDTILDHKAVTFWYDEYGVPIRWTSSPPEGGPAANTVCGSTSITSYWGTYFGGADAEEPWGAAIGSVSSGDAAIIRRRYLGASTLREWFGAYRRLKIAATSHGVARAIFYEGQYSPDFTGDANQNAMRAASKLSPDLRRMELTNCLMAQAAGCEQPSLLNIAVPHNAWAFKDDIYQAGTTPSEQGYLVDYVSGNYARLTKGAIASGSPSDVQSYAKPVTTWTSGTSADTNVTSSVVLGANTAALDVLARKFALDASPGTIIASQLYVLTAADITAGVAPLSHTWPALGSALPHGSVIRMWHEITHGSNVYIGDPATKTLTSTPTVLASDNFTRADVTPVAGGLGTTPVGGKTWVGNDAGIQSNQARFASGSTYQATAINCGASDVDITVNVVLGGSHARVLARSTADPHAGGPSVILATTGNLIYYDGASVHTIGTFTALATTGTHALRLVVKGDLMTAYVDGTQVASGTYTGLPVTNYVGFSDEGSNARFTGFSVSAAA